MSESARNEVPPAAPRTRAYDVVRGRLVPDVSHLDRDAVFARKREVEARLRATKHDPARAAERAAAKAEYDALDRRLTELSAAKKRENVRRNFAGLTSALHDAIAARFDASVVAELEREALRLLAERERRNAEARAARAAASTTSDEEVTP